MAVNKPKRSRFGIVLKLPLLFVFSEVLFFGYQSLVCICFSFEKFLLLNLQSRSFKGK